MFSVRGSDNFEGMIGRVDSIGWRVFSRVDVTVMYRVFFTVPTCKKMIIKLVTNFNDAKLCSTYLEGVR